MDAQRKRIAAVVTEYRPNSHADVIVGRFLEGYHIAGRFHAPRVEVVSLYTDQVPEKDMSRAMAARHGVPIFPTIAEALTLGGETLAVDGVVLVGEHGDYPHNEKGQHLYPRRRFFEETAAVMRAAGRSVPVFSDKHLSTSWENAHWMVGTARALGIPFMAGSSLPVTVRRPPLELPLGCALEEAVCVAYGPVEAYGFHALEVVQCMAERRGDGETGVAAVRCLEGPAVWDALAAGAWPAGGPGGVSCQSDPSDTAPTATASTTAALLSAALARCEKAKAGDPRENTPEPAAFQVRYRDGLIATVLLLNGHITEFAFAGRLKGEAEPAASLFHLWDAPYEHFSHLVRHVEEMLVTGRPQYPVERTLLTTGILDACMDSRYRGQVWVETPHLAVAYRAAT